MNVVVVEGPETFNPSLAVVVVTTVATNPTSLAVAVVEGPATINPSLAVVTAYLYSGEGSSDAERVVGCRRGLPVIKVRE